MNTIIVDEMSAEQLRIYCNAADDLAAGRPVAIVGENTDSVSAVVDIILDCIW